MSLLKMVGSLALLAGLTCGWGATEVQARSFRPGMLPNGSENSCANCHVNPAGGGDRNLFGQAVEARVTPNGQEAFWDATLAAEDSDGDGATNGEELGDPDGDGTAEAGVQVFLPGDANSVPPPPEPTGPSPDLDGNGNVDFFDLLEIANRARLANAGEPDFDDGLDFDGDGQVGIDDLLIFARNFNLSVDQLNLERPPDGIGPNAGAILSFDADVGNGLNDGLTNGFVGPVGSIFSVEVFIEPLQTSIDGARIRLEVDPSLLRVRDFIEAGGTAVKATNDFGLAVAFAGGLDLGESGFLGTVEFETTSDMTDIPTRVGVEFATVMEAGTQLRNDLDLSHAEILFNTQGPGEPQPVGPVPVASIDVAAEVLCIAGPSFQIESDDLTVEFPDGSVLTVAEARASGLVPPGTLIGVDFVHVDFGPPVATHIRVLDEAAGVGPVEGQMVGVVEQAVIEIGEVFLADECFLLTSESEVVEGEVFISLDDLNEKDIVIVTSGPPLAGDDRPTALKIERVEVAPPPEPFHDRGPVGLIEPENDLFCIEGPLFKIDREDLPVLLPDGTEMPVLDAAASGLIGSDTPVEVEIAFLEGGPPVALHIRVLNEESEAEPRENTIVGRIDGAELGVGEVQFAGRCFLLTDGTEVVEGGLPLPLDALNLGDEVLVTYDGGPVAGDLETAVRIERLHVAPVAFGRVVHIDFEGGSFDIESDEGLIETVLVLDHTEFVIRRSGPNGEDGSDDPTAVTKQADGESEEPFFDEEFVGFDALQVEDHVDVFGERNADGVIEADKVVIFRGEEPAVGGRVTHIDFEGSSFEVEVGPELFETVLVLDHTEFVIRQPGPHPENGIDDNPPLTKQVDGEEPFHDEFVGFDALQVNDHVEVFGERNADGVIEARFVAITRGDRPEVAGRVVHIDFEADLFEVEAGPELIETVLVLDHTEFVIRRSGPNGEDGSDDPTAVTKQADGESEEPFQDEFVGFDALQVEDHVEVFGERNADGVIEADKVVIFRGEEQPHPVVAGRVAHIDFDASLFEVEAAPDLIETVLVLGHTEFVIRRPGPNGEDGSDDPTAVTKQADGEFDEPFFDEEFVGFDALQVDDHVDVFGGRNADGVIEADKVVIFQGDERPPGQGPVGAISEISFDESFICIRGPVIRLEHPEIPVEFGDGFVLPVRDAEQRAELSRGTPVAIDVEFRHEGEPPVAHRIRVIHADELGEVPPDVLLGIVEEVNVREGSIRLAGLCFRLTDGTGATEDGIEIALEDLIPKDIVRVTPGPREPKDDLPTAETIERFERALVPIQVVSFTLGGQVLDEDVANPPLAPGLNDAELVFNEPVEVFGGEPENVEFQSFPPLVLEEDILDLQVGDDETTLTATFDLPEETTYQAFVGDPDVENLGDLSQFFFGTTDLQDVTLSGSAFHPDGRNLGPFTLVGLLNLDFLDAVGGLFKPATKAAVARAAKQVAAKQDEFDDEFSDDEGADLEVIVNSFVRVVQVDETSSFEVPFVPDGEYFLFVVDVRDITSFIGFPDEDGDGIPDVIEVSGQSISGLEIPLEKLRFEVEEFHEEGIVIAEVDRENGFVFVRTPEGPFRIDVSDATIFDREGEEIDLQEFNPGSRVNAWGTVFDDGSISLFELQVIEFEGPRSIFGRVISIQLPEADRPGRMSLAAAGFRFNEFETRVEDSSGRRISPLDLHPGLSVIILFRETEEMGQRGLIAEGIRVLRPGEPAPPPEPDLFVGQIADINFNERLIFGAVSLALFEGTEYFDRDGNETEVQPGSDVRVIPTETRFGIAARRVDVVREPGERAPEEILSAVFLINGEEVPVAGAVGVPLAAEARVTFNVPLSEIALDAVEVFVYSQETDTDVEVQKSVDADGNLVLEMTLSADDVYDGEIALESGAFFFATFTTSDALPSLLVESIDPEDGATNVGTVTTISVTFNRELNTDGDEVDAELFILPIPEGFTEIAGKITRALQGDENGGTDFGRPRISDDHLTISVDVELRPDQSYLVVIPDAGDVDGFRLNEIFKSRFSTGEPPTSTVAGSFVFPPNAQLDPVLRNGAGFVYMLPAELELGDLEGDEPERLGVAFDVTQSGDFEMPVSAGTYIVEGFVFIEEGPDGVEQGLVGTYQDDNGEPLELVVGDGVEITDIEIRVVSELRVTATRPFPGQTNLPAGVTTLSVQFSEPLAQHRGTPVLKAEIRPHIRNFDLQRSSQDPRRVETDVRLQADTDYVVIIHYARGVSGAELFDLFEIPISTRSEFGGGIVGGLVVRSDGLDPKGKVILGIPAEERLIAESRIRSDGSFGFENIPGVEFGLFAELTLDDGRKVYGTVDEDGDGKPDLFAIEPGEEITDLTIEVFVPEAPVAGETGGNEGATLSFDFDSGAGDGGDTVADLSPGDQFSVAVYVEGATALTAFDVTIGYDSQFLALEDDPEPESDEEGDNILTLNDGFGAFLNRVGEEGKGHLTGAILDPDDDVVVTGGGLLGVLNFVVLESFTTGTTELTIEGTFNLNLDEATSDAIGTVSVEALTGSIGLTADPSIVTDDGEDASTVEAQILDLEGNLQDDDNATVVTFSVDGVGVLSDEEVTVTNGVATTELTSDTAGSATVSASASGAQTATVEVAVIPGAGVSGAAAGPIALDLDLATGDGGVRFRTAEATIDEKLVVDVVAVSGAQDFAGVNLVLNYGVDAVAFDDFEESDLFSGALVIAAKGEGTLQISVAHTGGLVERDAGSIGQATFTALKDGVASVVLVSASFATASLEEFEQEIGAGGQTVTFGGTAAVRVGDIDGDGLVGFLDFVALGISFLKSEGDPLYNVDADLDGDGTVSFLDFVAFSINFNKKVVDIVLTKPVLPPVRNPNGKAELDLVPVQSQKSGEVDLLVRLNQVDEVGGFNLKVNYDPSAMAWLGAESQSVSRFANESGPAGVAIEDASRSGEVVLSDIFAAEGRLRGEGDLVRLKFRVLEETVGGRVEIAEALISDGWGQIRTILGSHLAEVRALPQDYALNQNFPNPFNPETQIVYQIPEASDVTLRIYNVLGQEVRVLEQGRKEAGFYRARWDGTDAFGRPVSSGIYFTQMVAEGFMDIRKMLLLK